MSELQSFIACTSRKMVGTPDAVCLPRFFAKVVEAERECWQWVGAKIRRESYGSFWFRGKSRLAHRVSYTLFVGPIQDGLQVDHLCGNRACVNPRHLAAVTPQENLRREIKHNSRKTHCSNGHEFAGGNLRVSHRSSGYMQRVCRACARIDYWMRRDKNTARKREIYHAMRNRDVATDPDVKP